MLVTPVFAQEAPGASHNTDAAVPLAPEGPQHLIEQEVAHEGVFPPFDATTYPSQLLWLAITFTLFYLFLKKVVLPRIGGILEVRRDRIAQDLDQAARLKQEADEAVAAYEQELAEARAKAQKIATETADVVKAEAEAERQKVEGALDAKLSEAEARIATIKATALKDVGTIAEQTAKAIVEELGLTADDKAVAAAVKAAGN
ncbi:F0F1 ATP synthase subunit B [Limoniibacter endophyticus]|uniref:ATP synthase subunit b n=1 Tax=Limoniibacter endophyticus TaxID=1565040 RepID=A0A8J3GHJ4_9HYPH|nr:F0F1 ATP synthase subunit B [Limoniibacter endophyticus]GHC71265.1 ATP synthase subunit b [Limoniibacter endophyticus]